MPPLGRKNLSPEGRRGGCQAEAVLRTGHLKTRHEIGFLPHG